jgi:hypothetical protein
MVVFALLLVVLIGMAAFAIDYGWLYLNQLNAEKAAEAAALAGVVHMPLPNCMAPDSGTDPNTVAHDVASRNGYQDGVGPVGVSVSQGATCAQLSVTVTDTIETFFMRVFGIQSLEINETATAEHLPNLKLGSDDPFLGEDPTLSGRNVDFFVAVNGDNTGKAQGDAFTSQYYGDYNTAHLGSNFEFNQSKPPDVIRPDGSASYYYAVQIPSNHQGSDLTVQIFDPQLNPGGVVDDRVLNNSHATWNPPVDSRLRFRLFEPDDTPNVWTDNDQMVCDRTYYYETHSNYDPSGKDSWTVSGDSYCADTAIQGIYVLEVTQTGDVDILNAFSLRALIGGSTSNDVAVYGLGSMSLWMFEAGSSARFKAVKLDDVYAGSRLIVQLWDVGDIDGTGSIQFKGSLDGWDCQIRERNADGSIAVDWHDDDGAGSGCLEVINPEREHNNEWLDFAFQLDGFTCDPTGEACWATVQYNLPGKPHDRTTWSAFIDGQPIHLVP